MRTQTITLHQPSNHPALQKILSQAERVTESKDGWTALCPTHDDHNPSLSIGIGEDGRVLLHCLANHGCTLEQIVKHFGLCIRDLAPPTGKKSQSRSDNRKIAAIYDYRDEHGTRLYQVVRYEPKGFVQRRPNGKEGWIYNLGSVRRVLYRLPDIMDEPGVCVVEGEKDADRLWQLGIPATTNVGGANAPWRPEYSETLRGKCIIVIGDNDQAGRKHARVVARSLLGVAQGVKLIEALPDVPEKGDISDWLDMGHDERDLKTLVHATPRLNRLDLPSEPTDTETEGLRESGEDRGVGPSRQSSQATQIVGLIEGAEFWHTPERDSYITIVRDSHKEHMPLHSEAFRLWLTQRFYYETGMIPSQRALEEALAKLEGDALFSGPEYPVYTRVAQVGARLYLSLANDEGEVVEITKDGWQLITDPPVKFIHSKGMKALPHPQRGGTMQDFRALVNVAEETDFYLLVGWLLNALHPQGPYLILAVNGEQGTAKTTLTKTLKALLDPHEVPLRAEPHSERDMMIAAKHTHILAYDNLSHIEKWFSDALCRLSTEAGHTTRALYTDDEEKLFHARRPVILNGIEEVATRPDLLDRLVLLTLPQIPATKRKTERAFWQEFAKAHSRILGVLLTAVSVALRESETLRLSELPRMADAVAWVVAAERGLGWKSGTFQRAYGENNRRADFLALEASPVASLIIRIVEDIELDDKEQWSGTATQLLNELNSMADDNFALKKTLPRTATGLSGQLRRLAPSLRRAGVEVIFSKEGKESTRTITLRKKGKPPEADAADDKAA